MENGIRSLCSFFGFVPIIMTMVSITEYTDLFMYIVGPLTLIYLFYEMTKVTLPKEKNCGRLWFYYFLFFLGNL